MMVGQKMRKIDIFKKIPHDFTEGTNIGGCVSIITMLAIFFFMYQQFSHYMHPILSTTLVPRQQGVSRKQMKIVLDIEFPRYPCELMSLDIQDQMFSHHPNLASVKKWRLDSIGNKIDKIDFELLRQPDPFVQLQMTRDSIKKKYGCRVVGDFTVHEAPGNFHISSHAYQANYVRLMMEGVLNETDVSHTIHRLQFGQIDAKKFQQLDPDAQLMRLNGFSRTYDQEATQHSYLSHYHLSIVPTIYEGSFRRKQSYQYTYNHNSWKTDDMPSGIAVDVSPKNSYFMSTITNLCFVIGGIYALAKFLNEFLLKIFGGKTGYQLIQ